MKIHLIDNRLKVNAGMNFPTCKANAELLDLDAAFLPLTNEPERVTCKHCIKVYHNKRRL